MCDRCSSERIGSERSEFAERDLSSSEGHTRTEPRGFYFSRAATLAGGHSGGDIMIECPNCHAQNEVHYKFCLACGSELNGEQGKIVNRPSLLIRLRVRELGCLGKKRQASWVDPPKKSPWMDPLRV